MPASSSCLAPLLTPRCGYLAPACLPRITAKCETERHLPRLPASLKSHASAHAAPSSGLRMSGPCLNAAGGMASPGSTHDSGQKDASYSQTPASPLGPQRLAGSAQPSHHSHVACNLVARSFHAAHRRQRGVHQLRERHFLAQLMHTCSSRRHASATVRRADPQRARCCALDIAFISAAAFALSCSGAGGYGPGIREARCARCIVWSRSSRSSGLTSQNTSPLFRALAPLRLT